MTQYDVDVGDFAQSILMEGQVKPGPITPDVSAEDEALAGIVVPDNFVESLIRAPASKPLPKRVKVVEQREKTVQEEVIVSKTARELLEEFKTLVAQAKKLVTEMTSCGMLGVNMAGHAKPKVVKKKKKVKVVESTDDIVAQVLREMKGQM